MRLKQIKLAGFKSFVDPTVVPFPEQLTAVVGPNGCGKSNIIDAVRWVLGESSAKNLRGDSMTDVIFNGSSGRAPASQASVELIFDNSEGRATGPVAGFSEISVRRVVTHEAQNTYYLNGTKCRRKDISDVFLGTGLGARSYAIIGQGMINKLVECRPQELRVIIEEAAGISKYKERRRETENRIRHTRENLERLQDVREELGKQLEKLQRQARAAERYRELKAQERQKKGELAAMRYQQLHERVDNFEQQQQALSLEQEKRQTLLTTNERQLSEAGVELHRQQGDQERLQEQFYQCGNQITRLEQQLEHGRQRKQRLSEEERRIRLGLEECEQLLAEDQEQQLMFSEELEAASMELELQQAAVEQAEADVLAQEEAVEQWQAQWQGLQQAVSSRRQRAEVLRSQLSGSQTSFERLGQRLAQSESRLAELGGSDEQQESLLLLEESQQELAMQQEELGDTQEQHQLELEQCREQLQQLRAEREQQKEQLLLGRGRIASLETLQQAAASAGDQQAWLEQSGLGQSRQLFEQLQVASGFERALEQVLGQWQLARLVERLPGEQLQDAGSLTHPVLLLTAGSQAQPSQPRPLLAGLKRLVDQISCQDEAVTAMLPAWLHQVYLVQDLAEAGRYQPELGNGESLVTPDGVWLGRNWLLAGKPADGSQGLLEQQAELAELTEQTEQLSDSLDKTEALLAEQQQAEQAARSQAEALSEQQQQLSRQQMELKSELAILQARQSQAQQQRQQLSEECSELRLQQAQEQESQETLAMELAAIEEQLLEQDDALQSQDAQRDSQQQQLRAARQQLEQQRQQVQQQTLQSANSRARQQSLAESIRRLSQQQQQQQQRLTEVSQELQQDDEPEDEQALQLSELLEQRLALEEKLLGFGDSVEQLRIRQHELQAEQIELRNQLQQGHNQLSQLKLDSEGFRVRRQGILEQLAEAGQDLKTLLSGLVEKASETSWQEELEKLGSAIKRLGAINLAAIDEYQAQSERKRYLDEQDADLMLALETLEGAIRRIDRETRTRFKETYDKVNQGLGELFPKVFGGGSASLALTDDDLLETGVTIMARPPGKKNSTIHLLSGGEKALTALSMVFAIFQLNPAPFCLLDEVDAPLDDANVGRFCNLVKEMSDTVQFIYISHNKIAMEMAAQLAGVTMREPGVSRMVAVDIDEAVAMSE